MGDITLKVIDADEDHIIVTTDVPFRIEVSTINGRLMLHGYKGTEIDLDQDPDVIWDGPEVAVSGYE